MQLSFNRKQSDSRTTSIFTDITITNYTFDILALYYIYLIMKTVININLHTMSDTDKTTLCCWLTVNIADIFTLHCTHYTSQILTLYLSILCALCTVT